MENIILARLPEAVILIYAVSILLYFIDFIEQNRKANRLAFRLLAVVWILQTIFLFGYMWQTGRFPVLTLFEGLYFYSWVLITLSLAVHNLLKVDFTVFFINLLGFSLLAIHAFAPMQGTGQMMGEQLISELLIIHITMAFLSYGAFSLAAVTSLLYLIQYRLLKKKKWKTKRVWRFSDLNKLETVAHVSNLVGVPMLLLSLILGLRWAFIQLPSFQLYDPKIIGSFVIILIYGLLIYLRLKKGVFGKRLAEWNAAAFLIVLINLFLSSRISTFHIWN